MDILFVTATRIGDAVLSTGLRTRSVCWPPLLRTRSSSGADLNFCPTI